MGMNPGPWEARMEEIVARHQTPLLRLCFAYLRDEELAKDAVQETFFKAYRGLKDFRGEASEKTWLTRIAINVCRDIRRSAWLRHTDRRVSPDMLPDSAAPVEDGEKALTIAIMRLPPKLREAALLCWYQGMNCQEAAAALGISHQAVSARIHRARKRLRQMLEGRDGYDF